jgi:uncharacterized protein (TIRG00374 family)
MRLWIGMTLSYTLAIACLLWVFFDYDFNDLLKRVAAMNLLLAATAITLDILSFVGQGYRCQVLLRPFGSISILRATQVLYVGVFINEVLPMKLGELMRAYLIFRWTTVKPDKVAGSIFIERLFDSVWLVSAFVVTMILLPLPRRFIQAGDALSLIVLIGLGLLLGLSWWTASPRFGSKSEPIDSTHQSQSVPGDDRERHIARRLARSLVGSLYEFATGLRVMIYSVSSLFAFGLSFLFVSLQWVAFWLLLLAFGVHLSLPAVVAVFVIVRVGTSLPGTPANIGTYQFFTVLGLTLFGIDKTSAAGFSLVAFVLLSIHIWILGFWGLHGSGLTIFGLRTELGQR